MTQPVPPLLHTPIEAAAQLGCSRTTIYELMASGRLDNIRIGTLRRIPHEALVRYIDDLKVSQTA